MEIINNPWITGIIGGIISGLIVYFITSRILSRKQNKEYSQKITTANNELLYIMRPLVVQKQIPSKEIMKSLIGSTARKHEVNKGDLLGIIPLADDLIREVMDNAFLESKQKIEFCDKINDLKITEERFKKTIKITAYEKDRIPSQYVSILLAVTASIMVLFVSLSTTIKGRFNLNELNNLSEVSTITLIGVIVPIMAMMMTTLLKKIKQNEQNKIWYKNYKNNFSKNPMLKGFTTKRK